MSEATTHDQKPDLSIADVRSRVEEIAAEVGEAPDTSEPMMRRGS